MIKSSPYVKPIIDKAETLEYKLVQTQDTLDEWIKCQRSWIYLEAIFSNGEDIREKMPLETKKFFDIDQNWRNTLMMLHDSNFLCELDTERLRGEFE